jgi:hypothetical protein
MEFLWSSHLGVMRNIGSCVKQPMNAMTAVALDDREPKLLHMLLDDVANLAVALARLHNLDGFRKSLVGDLHQLLVLLADISHEEGLVEITWI